MAKAKKLPSGSWRVQASVTVNGNVFKRSFTDATAKKAENAAEEWQRHCKIIGSDSTQMKVKEAIDLYIETHSKDLSPSTVREYERISKNDMQDIIDKPLYALTCPVIKASINKALEANLSPKTIKNRYGLLQRILSVYYPDFIWAVEYPKQKKKKKRLYSDELVKKIFQALRDTDFEVEAHLGMLSMRASEIAGTKWEDIDFKNKTLQVCRTKLINKDNEIELVDGTKTELSERTIYLPDYVCGILRNRHSTSESEYITTVKPNRFWANLNRILKKNDIEPLGFHELRHIYSSVSSKLGIDTQIRMANGGWSNEHIMNGVYRHPMSEEQQDANIKMNTYVNSVVGIEEIHMKIHTKLPKRLKLVRYGRF